MTQKSFHSMLRGSAGWLVRRAEWAVTRRAGLVGGVLSIALAGPLTCLHAQSTLNWQVSSVQQPPVVRSVPVLNSSIRYEPAAASQPVTPSQSLHWRYHASAIDSARRTAEQLRRSGQNDASMLATITFENATLAEQWVDLAQSIVNLESRLHDASGQFAAMQRDLDDAQHKLSQFGLTPTVGLLLRHKRDQLILWQANDSQSLSVSEELSRVRQQQLDIELMRHDGSDPAGQARRILSEAGYDANQNASLVSNLRRLLTERAQWLAVLKLAHGDYQQQLGQWDSTTTAALALMNEYRRLIDRHITWIRSGEPISTTDFRNLRGGIAELFNPQRSADFGPALQRKIKSDPGGAVGLLVGLIVLTVVRWRAKLWLIGVGNRQRLKDATPETRKLAASVLTVATATIIPAILLWISRWLSAGLVSESMLHASGGFAAAALVAIAMEVPRQLIRTSGFLDKHAGVELPHRMSAVRYGTLIGLGMVVAAYTITVMGSIDHGMWRDSVSRIGFMLAMLVAAWTAHLTLRPSGGWVEPLIARFGGSVIHRSRWVIYLAGIGFPIAMLVLSALGYQYTANESVKRACLSLAGGLIAATLWAAIKILSNRGWRTLTGTTHPARRIDHFGSFEPTRPDTNGAVVNGALADHFLELKHQLAFLCKCGLATAAVVAFGWLWIDLFPDVRMGNPVLWTVQEDETSRTVDAAGRQIFEPVLKTREITALHLMLAGVTLFVAFQLAKLLPALFDALVLQRVSFDEAMEHLSLVVGRCLLFGVGCFIACRFVGVRWQAIEWLAVGLTIGLGFGLQDIVRNVLGGLIVLFEKPAKLGDLISVGEVTGRVSMQRLRTTILSDEKGREVIVPNQNFVSADVINWMGAGRLSVIAIEVAVTREKRSVDVCRSLQQLVIDQPGVLLAPGPQATLVCVGQQTQRIEVRVWVEERNDIERFRDLLHRILIDDLREKRILASEQPTQRPLGEATAHQQRVRSSSQQRIAS